VVVIHIIGTILLVDAGFAALRAEKEAAASGLPEPRFLWLTVCAWVWQPVNMLGSYYRQHHPAPVSSSWPPTGGWGPSDSLLYFCLPWSVAVGVCCGFLVPRLLRRHSKPPNQSLQPTAGRSDA
jgi:hypothetical protein